MFLILKLSSTCSVHTPSLSQVEQPVFIRSGLQIFSHPYHCPLHPLESVYALLIKRPSQLGTMFQKRSDQWILCCQITEADQTHFAAHQNPKIPFTKVTTQKSIPNLVQLCKWCKTLHLPLVQICPTYQWFQTCVLCFMSVCQHISYPAQLVSAWHLISSPFTSSSR